MHFLSLVMAVLVSTVAVAAPKTLITYDGKAIGPGIAKSCKKLKPNSYSCTLDKSVDLGGDQAKVVKQSLESRLASSHGVAVTPKGASEVVIAFSGAENDFLDALSKTRIRAGSGVEIAAESTVSQGGIRAKTSERDPTSGEIKGKVVSVKGSKVALRVSNVSPEADALGIKPGQKVQIELPAGTSAAAEEVIFAVPTEKTGEVWKVKELKK